MEGISFSKGFKPQGCRHSIDTDAVTFAAGTLMWSLNSAAALRNLTIISGGQHSVGYGGYMTGGGHGALGATYGMAADQVLELEVVTPSGDIVIANECKNQDLFWAMRGVRVPFPNLQAIILTG
jgi:FAD/FMN-containing dehydrogenase